MADTLQIAIALLCATLAACATTPADRRPLTPSSDVPARAPADARIYAWPRSADEMRRLETTPPELARLSIAKSHVQHRFALALSDGPSEVWIDGQLVITPGGLPFPRVAVDLPYDSRQLPFVELVPGTHEVRFRVPRRSGKLDDQALTFDARPGGHYALVTLEVSQGGLPPWKRGFELTDLLFGTLIASPLVFYTGPLLVAAQALASAVTSAQESTCPGSCTSWIEDVDTGALAAGAMP